MKFIYIVSTTIGRDHSRQISNGLLRILKLQLLVEDTIQVDRNCSAAIHSSYEAFELLDYYYYCCLWNRGTSDTSLE